MLAVFAQLFLVGDDVEGRGQRTFNWRRWDRRGRGNVNEQQLTIEGIGKFLGRLECATRGLGWTVTVY